MTAHGHTVTPGTGPTGRVPAVPAGRGIVRTAWLAVLDIVHGIDAGSLVAHGQPVPPDHPARRACVRQSGKSPEERRTRRSRA